MNGYDQSGAPGAFRVPRDEFGFYRPGEEVPSGVNPPDGNILNAWRRNLDRAGTMMNDGGGDQQAGGGLMRYMNPQPGPYTSFASGYGRGKV